MPFQVVCPSCQRNAQVPENAAGRTVKCSCGAKFIASAPAETAIPDIPVNTSVESDLELQQRELPAQPPPRPPVTHGPRVSPRHVSSAGKSSGGFSMKMPAIIVLIIGVLCVAGYMLKKEGNETARQSSIVPQAQHEDKSAIVAEKPAEKKNQGFSTEGRKVVKEMLHKLSRTRSFMDKDKHRAILWIICVSASQDKDVDIDENFSDLLILADQAPAELNWITEHEWSNAGYLAMSEQLEKKDIPEGAIKYYAKLWTGWKVFSEILKEKKRTLIEQAKLDCGEE